jgi:hypothetical protein
MKIQKITLERVDVERQYASILKDVNRGLTAGEAYQNIEHIFKMSSASLLPLPVLHACYLKYWRQVRHWSRPAL